ncbi:kelch repeat protein [Geopyxis carbonaria]|nr:kelch repeat protein [Geopyxis carbonaria]
MVLWSSWLEVLVLLAPQCSAATVPGGEVNRVRSLHRRANSPTDVCARWSHQTAVVNDTIYIYGGQAKSEAKQKSNTWNNNFLTLSLNQDWDTSSPKLSGLPQPADPPDGPPPVANGYLWNDYETIYQYGGIFSDSPKTEPTEFALWAYDIKGKTWSDITSQTSISSDSGSKEIQRAGEGAGISVAGRNLGFYFGGHLDSYTTEGWSISTERVYLKSLLEYDMEKKEFRNVTNSGLEKAGVPERADGVLIFVPWGKEGILVAIGGGTNDTFSQMNIVDLYDLDTKKWTKQSTDGPTPKYRVNPCAVVASAADGSSHNIYLFGGQNLVPYMEQKQYDDIWILTIPSFTWVQVDQSSQSVPPARAGHTCDIVGSQMVVVGGFVGTELSCDSPGFYVFDVSTLKWTTSYSAAAGGYGNEQSGGNAISGGAGGLAVGGQYKVPKLVYDLVGGDGFGGAKVTKPVKAGDPNSPVMTGAATDYKYIQYITHPDGTTSIVTGDGGGKGPNVGAIVGGVVGGIILIVALVFVGLYILYKKKIRKLRESAAAAAEARRQEEATKNMAELPGDGYMPVMGVKRNGSSSDLNAIEGEPTFWGVLLSPRRSLRVVNH